LSFISGLSAVRSLGIAEHSAPGLKWSEETQPLSVWPLVDFFNSASELCWFSKIQKVS